MTETEMQIKLDGEYATAVDAVQVLSADRAGYLETVLTPEQKAKLLQYDLAIKQAIETQEAKKKEVVEALKQSGLSASVKAGRFQAVYTSPKEDWDGEKLNGMAILIPQLTQCKTMKPATWSIREVKGTK